MGKKPTILTSLLLAGALAAACDDPKPPPKRSPAVAPGPKAAPPPVAARVKKTKKAAKLELTEQDFTESTTNRDPFRSFMSEFKTAVAAPVIKEQRNVKLKRYALDEIKLVAVITGEIRAQAMFRDPKGLGVVVRRGELISESKARVKQISPGRVVVEIREEYEGGQEVKDRVIELHSKESKR